ncbi:CinA family nicotinamide mononucleotide deamidase-related protein [Thalassotalea sp. HSM 43]|uniref:CinA family nicotinamide mononucleotide deamidase-related protein n=1 Tax=Thalassotalea sp. HSM 43 TaxID=2552945 RepID=UPI0010819C38|nr:CinA family nicotinamide mononucleotide deamidase-related protein [Thalassotalea sp. HSM 43]QBY03780.1 CinA family nicotinamide mononucleotide deamidase-related protein [Thalassotalea sp. HSM 43]
MLNVQLLLTGNELMSGDIVDTNSVFLAQQLKSMGVELTRKTTVGDNLPLLVEQMQTLSQSADVVIINGGLGPTVDDMTAQALSEMSGRTLTIHPIALEQVKAWCVKRNYRLTGPNMKQALLPMECDIVDNPIGSAPGFSLRHNDCLIICTPGVPRELKAMFNEQIKPILKQMLPDSVQVVTDKMQVFGIGESGLQKMINESFPDWPESLELGFRASMPLLEVKLTSREKSQNTLRQTWFNKLKTLFGSHLINTDGANIQQTLVQLLQQKQLRMTTAESCTGGLIAAKVTSVAGSSQVFEAGYVTYSNQMKQAMLDVDAELLAQHGAVSEPVVIAMAKGALAKSNADYAVAVSGIAGPDGGSDEKPVGTVWLAWGSKDALQTTQLYFPAGRAYFQTYVANAALDLIRREVLEIDETPRYVTERQLPKQK